MTALIQVHFSLQFGFRTDNKQKDASVGGGEHIYHSEQDHCGVCSPYQMMKFENSEKYGRQAITVQSRLVFCTNGKA